MDKAGLAIKAYLQVLLLCCFAIITNVVNGQNPEFISIDCGLDEGAGYSDDTTGIVYRPDGAFVESGAGIIANIEREHITNNLDKHLWTLRSFPNGSRNCYDLSSSFSSSSSSSSSVKGKKVLIRASFMYGNYDGKNQTPNFTLHLGVELWDRVELRGPSDVARKEIIHVPSSDILEVCVVNTDEGTPFVSALELRPLNDSAYPTKGSYGMNESLVRYSRLNFGAQDNAFILRYPNDVRDRLWFPYAYTANQNLTSLSATPANPNEEIAQNAYEVPSKVMETAMSKSEETTEENLSLSWKPDDPTTDYYVYMHFAEVTRLLNNQTRSFYIYTNDNQLWYDHPVSPLYLRTNTIYAIRPASKAQWEFKFVKTKNSTLPPLINAVEIYAVKRFLKSQTRQPDVQAMMNIKSTYGLKRDNWVGDPCLPEQYKWEGLNCTYNANDPPIIKHLNLSASGLVGNISLSISNLTSLEYLDLSNNGLTGQIPSFLNELPSLKVLNLTGNQFSGPLPQELIERTKNGLILRIEGYGDTEPNNPCPSTNCDEKKTSKKFVVPVVASVITTFILLIGLIFLWRRKGKSNQVQLGGASERKDGLFLESRNRSFTYSEILKMTKNFERVLGKGGFGTVYHGCLGDIQVAVKLLSQSSVQGYHEFQTEAELLTRVHHRNLTSLVGYCYEDESMALVYEYMANGNLRDLLSEKSRRVLGWLERLQIAMDAAQGLDYLHNGCKPPIIHRDVKTTNILMNEKLQAKLADFGLSRAFTIDDGSYVSTRVVGTPGYLDPEYYESQRLTEKSDVYSFGIVILELISGRPVIIMNDEKPHIIQWVNLFLSSGDIRKIIDPILKEDFEVNSVWKALELAMACASPIPIRRPNMDYVVTELKECLAAEKVRREGHDEVSYYSEQVLEVIPIALGNNIIGPR